VLVELGEEFAHVELVLDRAAETLTAYILDGEAEQPVRVTVSSIRVAIEADPSALELELVPVASVLTGEAAGNTSQFAARHVGLRSSGPLKGRIGEIAVKGRAFRDVGFELPASKDAPRQ
jgi:hypothetical protein